jgi:hypothetical protein
MSDKTPDKKSFHFKNKPVPIKKEPEYELGSRSAHGVFIPPIVKQYTEEEKNNMKIGHFLVPEVRWKDLSPGTSFLYEDKEGNFHPCVGFVIKNADGVFSIGSRTSINGNYPVIDKKIPYETISKLYKKYAATAAIEVDMLVGCIKEITACLKEMKTEIATLEHRIEKLTKK